LLYNDAQKDVYLEMVPRADLLLTNARVLTMEHRQPLAEAVALQGETIMAVGGASEVTGLKGPNSRVIDCQGLTLLPGLIDAHCHLLALASSLTGIDCRPEKTRSIGELKKAVQQQARKTRPGQWIRGYGYDELSLAEHRHPNRFDLDEVAPHHPVRLDHRSGHATVLNTLGLGLARINRHTAEPPEGVIERDEGSSEPTGVLLEMSTFLRERLGTSRDEAELDAGIARANRMLLEYGITSVQDAGPGNDLTKWSTFQDLIESEKLQSRVTMMAGAAHIGECVNAGMCCGAGDDRLRLGHAKVMLTLTTGSLQPEIQELRQLVAATHRAGFPVAVHAVEAEAVAAAARVLQEGPRSVPAQGQPLGLDLPPDRIEHCSECPPELIARVKKSGAAVVTQPGFIYWNGDSYRERVEPGLLPHLYAIGTLTSAGIPVGFGSDTPVIDPNPWPAIYAAATRRTRNGSYLSEGEEDHLGQQVSVIDALRMYTTGGAWAEGTQTRKGSISAGKLADMVLVDADPTRVVPSELKIIKAILTIIGGKVVWDGGL
jgi:predicted amidohydrolase YtcJ